MPELSKLSRDRLATCHPDLRRVVEQVSRDEYVLVICGRRDEAQQNAAFLGGFSKKKYPDSRHNADPSEAVDLAPGPRIDWKDTKAFERLAAKMLKAAEEMGVAIVWGGDWKMRDLPHFELGGGGAGKKIG